MSIWWEKTVEYLFVLTYMTREALMAPLDGNYEAGGDLVASHNDKWVLIEFKRNASAIEDEVNKFAEPSIDSFNGAKAKLGDSDGHHFLIFGQEGDYEPLELRGITYFRHQGVGLEDVLCSGVAQDDFNSYISEFLSFKFGEAKGGAGGRSLNYSTVIAVNSDGLVTHCEGLTSYCNRMNLGPDFSPSPAPSPKRSMGMNGPS